MGLTAAQSNSAQFAYTPNLDPLDNEDIAFMIKACAMRANKFAWREMIPSQFAGRHIIGGGVVAKVQDDAVLFIH